MGVGSSVKVGGGGGGGFELNFLSQRSECVERTRSESRRLILSKKVGGEGGGNAPLSKKVRGICPLPLPPPPPSLFLRL